MQTRNIDGIPLKTNSHLMQEINHCNNVALIKEKATELSRH